MSTSGHVTCSPSMVSEEGNQARSIHVPCRATFLVFSGSPKSKTPFSPSRARTSPERSEGDTFFIFLSFFKIVPLVAPDRAPLILSVEIWIISSLYSLSRKIRNAL